MFDIERFVSQCEDAVARGDGVLAVKELVDRAVADADAVAAAVPSAAGVTVLHRGEALTVVNVVIPAGLPGTLPHDHRMWAVVGVYGGQEDNEFFRRREHGLAAKGGRSLRPSESLAMGDDTVHAIRNPSTHEALAALHVYGGDLPGTPRSMWVDLDADEEPYDEQRVIGSRMRT